eukprot:TRINITY_DN2260_c0_g1_i1.p1 TRINITY_DN2260_c0_g1~~TRINITY_DN2260_c0_g1_i1.p1  ORF type:complete len:116 (+),score=1.28 TRINITY_DN2260_c0_g1_i1:241-588(+)
MTSSCPNCYCGNTTSIYQSALACTQNSAWGASCCQCIINHASTANLYAVSFNATNNATTVGLWGISSVQWEMCSHGKPPCSFNANYLCAGLLYKAGGNTWYNFPACQACSCCNQS